MKVGIVGAGVMGTGVAQCFAAAGHDVVVADTDPRALDRGPARIRDGLRMAALLGRRPPAAVADRIRWTGRLGELGASEFVVECAAERLPVKEKLFGDLDRLCPAATVLASCTSAVPIGRLAAATARAERVVGTHFMNPAPLKDAVEVVRAAATGEEAVRTTTDVLAGLGKRAIVVADGPGFVANRVLMATINEAIATVGDGIADAVTVDQVFENCFGHTMGPLRTADLIGLDVILDTLVVLLECTGNPMYRPCPLLTELVGTGRLGRKTGRGLHAYPG
ncbi:3-hydroxyacyl-CoA dehydrogenase family protein [Amycolatopsis sp. A133]|uniref:3-hydroxyacyl-CoA dehydrogenase family protein n=1 Tax=Amycolatopsis sp. A133 TaxID=3064472 RepID=UPI0027E9AD54|nr:3-hydroxyacyl-CoA dehydrogenase family protein [Amycolatopsis sp. A133]MDQ7808838.1 3-hydroxyacyl-CoA dehydrogenase family protein [Amycolatopsis sp. A133]